MLRVKHDLSQQEMADKLGVARQTYGDIENGNASGSMKFWEAFQVEFSIPDAEMWELMKLEQEG